MRFIQQAGIVSVKNFLSFQLPVPSFLQSRLETYNSRPDTVSRFLLTQKYIWLKQYITISLMWFPVHGFLFRGDLILDILTFILIFLAGIAAAFVGGAAGGGGLISTPILMLLGFPPHVAIGTNKFGALGLTGISTHEYHKAGKIPYKIAIPVLIVVLAASVIGASTAALLDAETLKLGFGFIMIAAVGLTLLDKKMGLEKRELKKNHATFGMLLFVPIGLLSGVIGAGQGVLSVYVLVSLFGLSFLEGNGTKSFFSLFMVGVTAIIFALNGFVDLFAGGVLFAGMVIGSRIGAKTAIKKGDKWVKNIFLVLVVALAIKLLLF
jgi:uncharacterized membrane protein YfcA